MKLGETRSKAAHSSGVMISDVVVADVGTGISLPQKISF